MSSETLDQALGRIWQNEWQHKRSGPTLKSQAEIAVYTIKRIVTGKSGLEPREYVDVTAQQVSRFHVQQATSDWYATGLSPATITKRLNCLSKLGVIIEGNKVHVPKQLKWHLKESDKLRVLGWLRAWTTAGMWHPTDLLAFYIEWTTVTGLRIEETLRLTWGDFSQDFSAVSVPGLKTASSQATLPLGHKAQDVLVQLKAGAGLAIDSQRIFLTDYDELNAAWQEVRKHFGWQDDPTATLKALRRSAARYLHVDCGMPLDMVRQYLRHEGINTTLEYLRLTGGYGTEEMRRFLK